MKYCCSMHNEIISYKPGKCTKCGMKKRNRNIRNAAAMQILLYGRYKNQLTNLIAITDQHLCTTPPQKILLYSNQLFNLLKKGGLLWEHKH
jgi:hypothetical protein